MNFFSRAQLYSVVFLLALLGGCSDSDLEQGNRHFEAGAYDEAKADYMNVLRSDHYNAVASARLGQIWLEEGAPWRAGVFLEKAVQFSPQDLDSRLRLAEVYQAIGAENKAREMILKLLEQAPAKAEALVTLTELAQTPEEIAQAENAVETFPQKNTASYYVAKANLAMSKKDLMAAQAAINQALALAPASPDAHQAQGFLELRQNRIAAAEESFKTAAGLAPPRSQVHINFAEFIARKNGNQAAIAYLKTVTKKAPDFFPAWLTLARITLDEKEYQEAIDYLANIFSRDEDNVSARLLESDILIARGNTQKAVSVLKDLEKAHPGLAEIQYRMAKAYLKQERIPEATEAVNQALARNPNLIEAILTKAEISLKAGQPAEAISTLENLLQKHPNLKRAQTLLENARHATPSPTPK